MARRRFFVDQVRLGRAAVRGDEARHLRQVLRVEPGQTYELSDNASLYLAEVEKVRNEEVSFRIIETIPVEAPLFEVTLLLSLIKFDRFEWALEKATELGVARVIPVNAVRSEKGLACAALKRLERWRRIARESSQQSRRARLPEICAPVAFSDALLAPGPRFFLDERGGEPLVSAAGNAPTDRPCVIVGPEGGWTEEERGSAAAAGWARVSLGSNILRAETAAIAALAVFSSVLEARAAVHS